ncbi:helix-turn-helix transcriptional regulator [Kineosporia mesophila]|uniref:Helix-turn-helix transcriptional regulator n=1 Tax=Kineosporia mesophila TaxID=566012 RepID=A0ABP6YWS9_9ACTN|nr:helix-turn-helix domain-containing protein [Kineosporia mesophila]
MTTPGGPTVRRILVGAQLRRLRESRNLTREAAGYRIRASESKISRLELGRVGFKDRDIVDLLELYGVEDEAQREMLVALAREANAPGWWHSYDDVLPNWFETFVGLEEAASMIRSYEIQFLPGLLQTEAYARAMVSSGAPNATVAEVERRVNFRVKRQAILRRDSPSHLWTVVDEAALHRPVGGAKVMREQVEHLLDMMTLPNVTLQVMPFRYGGHVVDGGAFTLLRFPEPELPDTVYVEHLTSAHYLDKPDHVERYTQNMDRLTVDSLPPDMTRRTLQKLLAEA